MPRLRERIRRLLRLQRSTRAAAEAPSLQATQAPPSPTPSPPPLPRDQRFGLLRRIAKRTADLARDSTVARTGRSQPQPANVESEPVTADESAPSDLEEYAHAGAKRAAEIRRQQPRPEMRESEAGPSSSLADVEMVEEVQQETGYLARLAHASDLHLDPDAPDDPVIHIPKRLDFAYSRKLGVDAEAAIVKTLRKCGKPLNSPTLKVSELPLARLPHNGALLFWRYSPHHEGTHLAKLDNISRPLLQRYCEQNAELQIIVIASTLRGRDTSEDEWERWLEPWLNLKTYISFSKKIGCTKRQWDELKLRERAQQVVKAAATLDIEVAIENMRLDPLHQTVKEVLEQVELHQFELDGARFPDLLFPRGVGPWDNHKFTKAECNRDAVEKLPELRKALLAYGDNVDAQAEALKTAYFVWQLRYLLGAIMFYSIKPFSIYWLVVFNKDQLARMLIKWAKCKKDARRTRIADIFTRNEVIRMAAVTEAGTRQWNIWKAAHPDYRAVMWMGKRAFLKKWARTAMDRAGPQGSVEAWEAEYERLFQMVLDMAFAEKTFCYLCGVELTYDRRMFAGLTSEDVGGLLITTTNFSPDRRVPGTLYGLQTTEPCCWGCNCVKGGYPEANARVLLDTLAAADHTLDDDYFMIPVPSPATAEASAAGDDYNWRVEKHWARAAMEKARSSGAANPRKAGVLTFDHVMGLAREISLRDGRARDPCGAALPWALMTLDRIDCSRPYEDGNVRILCDSLNRLRKNLRNDRISSSYLDRIKGCQLATVVDVEQGLPGWSKTRKWMADERGDLIGAGVDPFADEDEESLDEDDMMQVSDWEDASGDEGADAGDEDDDEDEEGEGALQRLLAEIDEDDDDDERGEEALAEAASA